MSDSDEESDSGVGQVSAVQLLQRLEHTEKKKDLFMFLFALCFSSLHAFDL